jgi:hypothetical protein
MFCRFLLFAGLIFQTPFLLANTYQKTGGELVKEATSEPVVIPSFPIQLDQAAAPVSNAYLDHPANTCVGSTISLSPAHDVSVSRGELTNTSLLTVAGNLQYAYLQFDLTDVPVSPVNLALQLFTEKTEDLTILFAYHANSSVWTESSNIQQLPDPSVLLGSALINFANSAYQSIYLKREMLSSGPESLVLSVINDSNNVLIWSKESEFEPRLQIFGTDGFCSEYTANKQARLANDAPNDALQDDQPAVQDSPVNQPQAETPTQTPDTPADNPFAREGSDSMADDGPLASGGSSGGALNPLFTVLLLMIRRQFLRPSR